MTKLTNNFTLEEFYKSSTADKYKIDNKIPEKYLNNVKELAKHLQIIRDMWGDSIIISSGYRSKSLNSKVGGAKTSLHLHGLAADFSAKDKSKNGELFNSIKALIKGGKLKIRSLIWEYGDSKNPSWIHLDINGEGHTYKNNNIVYIYK